jgi:hypothetical protein
MYFMAVPHWSLATVGPPIKYSKWMPPRNEACLALMQLDVSVKWPSETVPIVVLYNTIARLIIDQ